MCPENLMTLIMLEREDREAAWDYHNEVIAKVRKKGPNYTHLETKDRFFVGRCGEIALRKWLTQTGVDFSETVNSEGVADRQDFVIWARKSGRECRVNVKNSHVPGARYLMIPASQWGAHTQDLYIAATGEDDGERVAMLLWGGITRSEFEEKHDEVMHSIRTMQVPCGEMTYDMQRIARSFRRREK
jgi:hypothetical protein